MRFTKFLFIVTVLATVAAPARAEVFQWGDPDLNLSMTFPDTWRRVGNQQPDDVVTIAAPGSNDYATCRLRVSEDRRSVIYPREYAAAIQRKDYSFDFWEGYVGQYRAATINRVLDNASLGKEFASMADVSFISPAGPKVQMRGVMLAGVYNDHAYVAECSSEASVFEKWYRPFMGVIHSVDMRSEYTTTVNGGYRPFQKDGKWKIHAVQPQDLYFYP